MPELIVGSVPRRGDYFGREELIETLWSRLQHSNVLLVAPRRFGKTGAMYRLLDEPRETFRPLYIDVEHINSAANFMVELVALLLRDRHFHRVVEKLLEGTKELGAFVRDLPASVDIGAFKIKIRERSDVREHWLSYGERVMELLAAEGSHPLLMIDEFPIMLEEISGRDAAEARQLLRWFRAARTAPNTGVRFVIGGSINLVATLDRMGLVDTINDLQLVRLRPFTRETAQQFIEAVFSERESTLTPAVRDAILDLVGEPIPYILTVLLTAIFDRAGPKPAPIDAGIVRAAFEEDVLGGATSAVFQHYRTRIDRFYIGGEATAAKAILRLLSRAEQPVSRNTLYTVYLQAAGGAHSESAEDDFSRLMGKLDNDFYIQSSNSSYAFFSRVLQLWWRAQYGYQE
jgi:hypothetical protein